MDTRRKRGLASMVAMQLVYACLIVGAIAASGAPLRPVETGVASIYSGDFGGKSTASGERYDGNAMTAAHRTLPLGTEVRVTRIDNGKSVRVRINDRGPNVADRIIDLSSRAAREIGLQSGVVKVRVEVLNMPPASRARPEREK